MNGEALKQLFLLNPEAAEFNLDENVKKLLVHQFWVEEDQRDDIAVLSYCIRRMEEQGQAPASIDNLTSEKNPSDYERSSAILDNLNKLKSENYRVYWRLTLSLQHIIQQLEQS